MFQLKEVKMDIQVMVSVFLEAERIVLKIFLNWKNNDKNAIFPFFSDVKCHKIDIIRQNSIEYLGF